MILRDKIKRLALKAFDPPATPDSKFDPHKLMSKDVLPVSVVISGRNYAEYLPDCIDSVMRQRPCPREIVYMDNASDDDSVKVALSRGLKVGVVGPAPRNICALRNRGIRMTKEEFLIFVDADDVLPQGYAKALLDGFTERRIGIVCPRHTSFGLFESDGYGAVTPNVYHQNYIAGQSMVRRRALISVGGWGDLPVFQDWELWLRIIEQGWLVKRLGNVRYEHRTHADSLTAMFQNRIPWYQEVLWRRPLTVFTPFGPGRPITGDRYFDMLESLGLAWERTTLFFYDNTGNAETGYALRRYLADCPAANTIYLKDDTRVSYNNIENRVMVMPERMAEMWSRATPHFSTPFILSIEDDNEPKKKGAARKLFEGMAPDVDAVTGIYYSRPIVDTNRLLALEWHARKDGALTLRRIERFPGDLPQPPRAGCTPIGATGVGFVLIRGDVVKDFDYPVGRPGNWCGQDFGVWRHVKERGRRLMAHWGVPTRHYHTRKEWV